MKPHEGTMTSCRTKHIHSRGLSDGQSHAGALFRRLDQGGPSAPNHSQCSPMMPQLPTTHSLVPLHSDMSGHGEHDGPNAPHALPTPAPSR